MKKNLLTAHSALLFTLLLFTGCRKETIESALLSQEADRLASNQSAQKSTCRLIHWKGLDDGYLRTLHYNNHGLLDSWSEANPNYDFYLLFTFEYDKNKRVLKVKYYDHSDLLYTIIPVYKNGRITKELWYVANTKALDDTVVNTYNAKGQMVKRESLHYDYYYRVIYDAIGNVIKGALLDIDGTVYQTDSFLYDKPVREPMTAIPGMPYPIPYINYIISELKFTYYKYVYLDEEGNLVTGYELDPEKSTPLKAGPDHYAVYFNTFEIVSGLYNRQVWNYQNCDCDKEDEVQQVSPPAFSISPSPGKNRRSPYVSMTQMREQIKQIRRQQNKK